MKEFITEPSGEIVCNKVFIKPFLENTRVIKHFLVICILLKEFWITLFVSFVLRTKKMLLFWFLSSLRRSSIMHPLRNQNKSTLVKKAACTWIFCFWCHISSTRILSYKDLLSSSIPKKSCHKSQELLHKKQWTFLKT